MPKYRPAARIRRGKTASETCICARVVTGSYLRTSAILDQGPIDICDVEIHTARLQSIHCGLPASWTRARRHPPSSPSPVASRGGGRGLVFLNWTRVQLDVRLVRREACRMRVHLQRLTCLPTLVRTVHQAQKTWSESRGRHVSHGIRQALSGRGACSSRHGQ